MADLGFFFSQDDTKRYTSQTYTLPLPIKKSTPSAPAWDVLIW